MLNCDRSTVKHALQDSLCEVTATSLLSSDSSKVQGRGKERGRGKREGEEREGNVKGRERK